MLKRKTLKNMEDLKKTTRKRCKISKVKLSSLKIDNECYKSILDLAGSTNYSLLDTSIFFTKVKKLNMIVLIIFINQYEGTKTYNWIVGF